MAISFQDLLDAIKSGNSLNTIGLDLNQYLSDNSSSSGSTSSTSTSTANANTSATSTQSPYSLESWIQSQGYSVNKNQLTGSYSIGNISIPSNLISQLNDVNGSLYGNQDVYQSILDTYNQYASVPQYTSPYAQQLESLYQELEDFQAYKTPQEFQDYITQLMEASQQPFTYSPLEDQALQTAQKEADRQVREASGAKGTLYSSGTISKSAMAQGALIPEFEQRAYSRFADQRQRELQLASTIMQWDSMMADRTMDQLEIIKTKFDYVMNLEQMDFEKFATMLQQSNFEREIKLEQERFALEKQEMEIANAWSRVDTLGYVDSKTSVILGLPVETKAEWVKQMELQQKQSLELAKKEYENQVKLQKEQQKIDKALINYKQKLEEAAAKTQMAKQYEYDKKLLEMQKSIELASMTSTQSAGILATANTLMGLKYVYGGTSTSKGMDCSAYTQWVFKQNGISIPRTAAEQAKKGTTVAFKDLQPGDLVFYNTISGNGKSVDHVGIYQGNGKMIHESSSKGVTTTNINDKYWTSKFTTAKRMSGGSGSGSGGSGSGSGGSGSVGRNSSQLSTTKLQSYMKQLGYYSGSVDGKYGPATTAAIKAFQKDHKLAVDGNFGPQSYSTLNKYYASKLK